MSLILRLSTRHTDTYAGTPYVHAGVLLALTELAYAEFERSAGIAKPEHVIAVEVRTRAEYSAPLHWRDGATIETSTSAAAARGFTQAYLVRSASSDRLIARIEHDWVWLNVESGRAVELDEATQARLVAG